MLQAPGVFWCLTKKKKKERVHARRLCQHMQPHLQANFQCRSLKFEALVNSAVCAASLVVFVVWSAGNEGKRTLFARSTLARGNGLCPRRQGHRLFRTVTEEIQVSRGTQQPLEAKSRREQQEKPENPAETAQEKIPSDPK